jgi:hypothetical protein
MLYVLGGFAHVYVGTKQMIFLHPIRLIAVGKSEIYELFIV